jgi:hypothetical protein
MKKNYMIVFAAIAALIVLCAFWGCSSSDDDDDPSLLLPLAEEASLGNAEITSIVTNGQIFKKSDGNPLNSISAGSVWTSVSMTGSSYSSAVALHSSITTDGKLTLQLPVFTQWDDVDPAWVQNEVLGQEGLTVVINPPDVRTVSVGAVFASGVSDIRNTNGSQRNEYWYADRDAVIQVVKNNGVGEPVILLNLNLKKGWNSTIMTEGTGGKIGRPDSSFKWTTYDD